jgi:hypothetical protein
VSLFPPLRLPFDGGLLRPYEAGDAPDVAAGCGDDETLRNAGYVHGGRVDLVVHSLIPADV